MSTPVRRGSDDRLERFRSAYAAQRAHEGRGAGGEAELYALPYLRTGPTAAAWRVRARTFERFIAVVIERRARECARALRVVDLGAGNGWLCHRLQQLGHVAVALDVRTDDVDGLGAAAAFASRPTRMFSRIAASFEAVPLAARTFDVVVFNASLHYALSLGGTLAEAARLTLPGGRIAILDSPFYPAESDGMSMVAAKHAGATASFGSRAHDLLALPFIEFLTPERLHAASAPLGLVWRRHRVFYPLRYEARAWAARIRRRRRPSRFDLWETVVP